VFVTAYLTGVFLLGSYSAAFITHLTLRDPVLPFTDFAGLLKDGSYRLGMAQNSAQLEYFKVSSLLTVSVTAHRVLFAQESNVSKTGAVSVLR
jgi:hypothetical protein